MKHEVELCYILINPAQVNNPCVSPISFISWYYYWVEKSPILKSLLFESSGMRRFLSLCYK